MNRARSYPAAKIPDDVKTFIARLYVIQREQGKIRKDFVNEVSRAGYDLSESLTDGFLILIREAVLYPLRNRAVNWLLWIGIRETLFVGGFSTAMPMAFQFIWTPTAHSSTTSLKLIYLLRQPPIICMMTDSHIARCKRKERVLPWTSII